MAITELQVDNGSTPGTSTHEEALYDKQEKSSADNSTNVQSIDGKREENHQDIDNELKLLFLDNGKLIYTKELFLTLPKDYHKAITDLILKTTMNNEAHLNKLLEIANLRQEDFFSNKAACSKKNSSVQ